MKAILKAIKILGIITVVAGAGLLAYFTYDAYKDEDNNEGIFNSYI